MSAPQPRPVTDEDLLNRFTYHRPRPDDAHLFQVIRETGLLFAAEVRDLCPPGRETSLAITAIEEAVMWANAAIARQGEADV